MIDALTYLAVACLIVAVYYAGVVTGIVVAVQGGDGEQMSAQNSKDK